MNSKEHNDEERGSQDETVSDVDFESEDELGAGAFKAKLKKLKDELEKVKIERQEYLDGWQRCKADTVNERREALAAAERAGSRSRDALVEDVIPSLDSFDMAIGNDAWQKLDANWRKGMENVYSQLLGALEKHGVRPFGAVGDTFDPFLHETVQEVEAEGAPGAIVRVLRRGYRSAERVVRPAQVAIIAKTS